MSSSEQPLIKLAENILANTKTIENFLVSNNLPEPSFSADGPTDFPVGIDHAEIQNARNAVIDATKELRDLIIGPRDMLRWMIINDHTISAAMHVAYHFKLAQAVPLPGSITFEDLAKKTGLTVTNVARFIRRLAIAHVFAESPPGNVSHTAASALIHSDANMYALLGHMMEEAYGSSCKVVEALTRYPLGAGEPHESPFTLFFGESFFERKVSQPDTMLRFGRAMSCWSEGDGSDHMRDGYPWAELGVGTVVDVGAAVGHISLAIAAKYPDLRFIVEDQPAIADEAVRFIGAAPEGVRRQVKFVPTDFFQPQPVEAKGAKAFILKHIFHDWSNKYALKIMKNVVDAMGPDSRLIIADAVMPPAGLLPRAQEEILRSFDILMLEQLNAQERDLGAWEALVKEGSGGKLKITSVTNPPKGGAVSIIECKFSA